MDSRRFDALTRTFSATDTRRAVLRLVAALPVAGALAALRPEEGEAGRRRRRKARHDPGQDKDNRKGKRKGKGKKKGKGKGKGQHQGQKQDPGQDQRPDLSAPPEPAPEPSCIPKSKAQTCAGKCATVTDNCGTVVDCGPCACDPPCPACQVCDARTGACISDRAAEGEACETCRTCDAAGQCAKVADDTPCDDGNACTRTDTCQNGVCVGGNPVVCTALDQCHDVGTCNPNTGRCSDPKKADGTTCDDGDACTIDDACTNGVCAGTAVICPATECQVAGTCNAASGCPDPTNKADGTACNGCNSTCSNGICAGPPVDLQTDEANCGVCGRACGANQHCAGGRCACDAGYSTCQAPDGLTCTQGACCRDRYGRCCANGLTDRHGSCCDSGVLNRLGSCCYSGVLDEIGRCCCPGSTQGADTCETGFESRDCQVHG